MYSDSTHLQGSKKQNFPSFLIKFLKTIKFCEVILSSLKKLNELRNVKSRELKAIEQSHLDARFATPESTLTVPNYSVGNFKF